MSHEQAERVIELLSQIENRLAFIVAFLNRLKIPPFLLGR
jgi:hypothetical protein